MKIEIVHIDTCLPDYWQGHSRPHVGVEVDRGTTASEAREAIRWEIWNGYVSGTSDDARLMGDGWVPHEKVERADALTHAAYAAINRLRFNRKRKPWKDLPEDACPTAYFVFHVIE